MRRWTWVLLLLAGCKGCKGCQPSLPDDEPENTDETSDSDVRPTDTGEPPPCDAPEVEPDDVPAQATPLPLEARACGTFEREFDFDVWSFELPEASWLRVRVIAEHIASKADVALLLEHEDDDAVATLITGMHDSRDVDLRFPAPAGGYTAWLSENAAQGNPEEYFYELVASVSKAPVEWTAAEVEPNGTIAQAQEVGDGDVIFGGFGADADVDTYVVGVPAGKHTITVDVDAFEAGSAANLTLVVLDGNGQYVTEELYGPMGWELDPYLEYTSTGDELVYIRVVEASGRGGTALWYTFSVGLEGSD